MKTKQSKDPFHPLFKLSIDRRENGRIFFFPHGLIPEFPQAKTCIIK